MDLHSMRNRIAAAAAAATVAAVLCIAGCGFISLEELVIVTFPGERNTEIEEGDELWISFSIPPVREKSEPLFTVQRDGAPVLGDYRWEEGTNGGVLSTLYFQPAPALAPGVRYTLRFEGTVKTEDNRSFEKNIAVPFFVGSEQTPARLLLADPADGETAAAGSPLRLRFSRPVDPDTFRKHFSVSPNPEGGYALSWNGAADTAEVRPARQWEPMTSYRWTVSSELRDAAGVPIAGEYAGSFIVQEDTTPPRLLGLTPAVLVDGIFYDQDDFGLTDPVRLTFSETLDLPTLQSGFSISPEVPGRIESLGGGEYVFFPETPYTPAEEHLISLSADIEDLNGNRMGTKIFRTFTPIVPPQSVLSIDSSGLSSAITEFGRVHPEPAVPGGPDNLLDFIITFARPYGPRFRPAVTESITCFAVFPPGGPVNPILETVSWDPGGSVLVLTYLGFERSAADGPGRNQYKLAIPGGAETSINQDGSYLKDDVWIIVEAEKQ
jgi:hypothetical protein